MVCESVIIEKCDCSVFFFCMSLIYIRRFQCKLEPNGSHSKHSYSLCCRVVSCFFLHLNDMFDAQSQRSDHEHTEKNCHLFDLKQNSFEYCCAFAHKFSVTKQYFLLIRCVYFFSAHEPITLSCHFTYKTQIQ